MPAAASRSRLRHSRKLWRPALFRIPLNHRLPILGLAFRSVGVVGQPSGTAYGIRDSGNELYAGHAADQGYRLSAVRPLGKKAGLCDGVARVYS